MNKELIDLITSQPAAGFTVVWPAARYLLEPLAAFSAYVLGFSRYIIQLVSWLAWLAVICGGWQVIRRRSLRAAVSAVAGAWLFLLTLIVVVMLFPVTPPRLVAPAGVTVIDLHSHSFYSHDGVKSPPQAVAYHRRLGFDAFFITEHGHTDGYPRFSPSARDTAVLPGMQVSTKERVSLLVLSPAPFDGRQYRDKTVQEVIDLAHRNGCVVICPHWWKWRHFTWQELYEKGIDGFEVYNAGYRNFSYEERGRLIAFCRERGLVTIGTTDWHGWGGTTDVWTVLPIQKPAAGDAIVNHLRRHGPTRVLVSRRPEQQTTLRYIFEPFYGAWYYLSSITVPQAAGWLGWVIVFFILRRAARPVVFRKLVPRACSAGLLVLAGWQLYRWAPLLPENMILGRLLAPILITLGVCWLIYARWGTPSEKMVSDVLEGTRS